MSLILRELTEQDEEAFFAGMLEWEGEELSWYTFAWKAGMPYSEMLQILAREAAGINLAPGRVQHTMLYCFLEEKIIGRVSVRHELNDNLRKRGGHLGYSVAPRFRQQGFAGEMVRGALAYCRQLGLQSILVTCGDNKTPSWKLIERNGGKLENLIWDEEDKETIRRYWIELS